MRLTAVSQDDRHAAGNQSLWQAASALCGRLGGVGRSSLQLLIMRFGNTLLLFAVSLLLTRALGATEYGVYSFGAALLAVLIVPASLGFQNLLAAELPALLARGEQRQARGLVGRATGLALIAALVIAGGWALTAVWQPPIIAPSLWTGGAVALVALLPFALLQVRLGALRGQHRVVEGQLPLFILQPAIMLLGALAVLFSASERFDGVAATALLAASFGAACLLAILVMPPLFESSAGGMAYTPAERLLPRILHFVVIGGVAVVIAQTGVLMLGALVGPKQAGLYQPAVLLSAFVSLGHNIINQPLGPRIAQLNAENRRAMMQRTLDQAFWAGLCFALPVALVLTFAGRPVLSLFGPEFESAATALALLAGGQLLSVCLGPSAITLMMLGREKLLSGLMATTAAVTLGLNALLIPLWGIEGAALAALLTVAFWSSVSAFLAARVLGLRSSVLTGWLVRKPQEVAP